LVITLNRVRGLRFFSRILGQPVYLPDGTLLGFIERIALRRKSGKAFEIHIGLPNGAVVKVKPSHICISHGVLLASPQLAGKHANHRGLAPSASASRAVKKLRDILKGLKFGRNRTRMQSLALIPNARHKIDEHDAANALGELASTLSREALGTKGDEALARSATGEPQPRNTSGIRACIDFNNVEYSIDEFIDRFLRG